jgi:hypothetical protein
MSNNLQGVYQTPSRPRSYKFYSPEQQPSVQVLRIVSVEKKILPPPLTRNHLSPVKKLIQPSKDGLLPFNVFQSFGSKSCVRLNAASNSFNRSVANQ